MFVMVLVVTAEEEASGPVNAKKPAAATNVIINIPTSISAVKKPPESFFRHNSIL